MADLIKRRLIEQLPEVHRTETLRRFFDATLDQVFQPGTSEPFAGYIGQKPSYFDPNKDFHVPEPTEQRAAYQLEAAMVQTDATGAVERALPYDDLIGYLAAIGADTSDHQRLFENDAYSWAPPIDLDKITNHRFYYWFGGAAGLASLPSLPLITPFMAYIGDGSRSFALPAETIAGATDSPVLLVNGAEVPFERSDNALVADVAPMAGALVLALRYGDLKAAIEDRITITPRFHWPEAYVLRTQGDGRARRFALPTGPSGANLTPAVTVNGTLVGVTSWDADTVLLEEVPPEGSDLAIFRDARLATLAVSIGLGPRNAPRLTTGMRVRMIDAGSLSGGETTDYLLEGIGRKVRLVPFSDMLWDSPDPSEDDPDRRTDIPAQHVTIERGCLDRNPWSIRNHWVHQEAFV